MLLAEPRLVAGEHEAPEPKEGEDGAAEAAEDKCRLISPQPPAVAVERGRGVVDGRKDHGCVGVGGHGSRRSCLTM